MIFEEHIKFKKIKSYFGTLFGALGGITGGMFSTNGPPITLYLCNQIQSKQILRSTLITIFLIDSVWRNSLYAITGTFSLEMLKIVGIMIPILIIATIIGAKAHFKVSQNVYRKVVGIILLISGILLLF